MYQWAGRVVGNVTIAEQIGTGVCVCEERNVNASTM